MDYDVYVSCTVRRFGFGLLAGGMWPPDGIVIGIVLFLAIGFGLAYWLTQRTNKQRIITASSQRVTLNAHGIENANKSWQEVYLYKDIEKLVVVRAKSGELKGIALELPKKLVDLSTLEHLDELYDALIERLPQISVQTNSVPWRRPATIGGILLVLSVYIVPRYFFPDSEWVNELVIFGAFLSMGIYARWGRELISGPFRQRRSARIYFGVASMYALGLVVRFFSN